MSAILLPAPSTATPTLQRLNSRGMLRRLSSSDNHALARKTHQHHHHHDENDSKTPHWLAPPLAPKVMEPERHSKAADASVRLQRIEYVQIADVVQREDDSKHYYVIHVYLKQEQSRIPTNQSRFQRALRSGHDTTRAPDFTIERRFSEFEQLRKEMWTTVQHAHRHYCSFCDSYMFLLLFSSAQPGVLAKTVFKSPEARAKLLDKFLHNVVDQFQRNRPACRIACYSLGHLPLVLHDFLFGGDEHEPRASVVSDASDASVDPAE